MFFILYQAKKNKITTNYQNKNNNINTYKIGNILYKTSIPNSAEVNVLYTNIIQLLGLFGQAEEEFIVLTDKDFLSNLMFSLYNNLIEYNHELLYKIFCDLKNLIICINSAGVDNIYIRVKLNFESGEF